MPDSDETRTITGWQTAAKFYRRPPGLGWLLALLVVPLLLGLIGWSDLDRSGRDSDLTLSTLDPTATSTDLTDPARTTPSIDLPDVSFAPFSVMRSGNGFVLSGDLPDVEAKVALLDALRDAFGPDVKVTDDLNIRGGIPAPDFAAFVDVFNASGEIQEFSIDLNGDTVWLTGTAPSEDSKGAVAAAAGAAWPDLNIVNGIQVPAVPVPGGGGCANLQADINALLRTPINFAANGFSLASESEQMLTQVADKLKACPDARAEVVGHTDNTGSDAINVPLSANRAKSVADFLVSQGVGRDRVTSRGVGAAQPVASNDSPEGRAQNRRVAITVS